MTTDLAASVAFYSDLFGWRVEETEMGDGPYSRIHVGDAAIGGFVPIDPRHEQPSHWIGYVSVTDVGAAVDRAEENGADVPLPSMDTEGFGTMALVIDECGAVTAPFTFAAEEPAEGPYRSRRDVWAAAQLDAADAEWSVEFYARLYGWTITEDEGPRGAYWTIRRNGKGIGGIQAREGEPDGEPSSWFYFVHVPDLAVAEKRALSLGAEVTTALTTIPGGRYAIAADPTGGRFAMFEPAIAGHDARSSVRRYWSFYWPLALTGVVMLVTPLAQNALLAHLPGAERELAIFARAWSTFALFNAALVFVPQMSNVLARSRRDNAVTLRFTLLALMALALPMLFLGHASVGHALLGTVFATRDAALDAVTRYVRWLTPLMVLNGLRHYHVGLLVARHRTRLVTTLNIVHVVSAVGILWLGFTTGTSPLATIVTAQLTAASVHLGLCVGYVYPLREAGDDAPDGARDPVTLRAAFRYFWPVATTSAMFALSRPIIYSVVGRAADGETTIAALKVAFDASMIFHMPLNQFRHLFATFGTGERRGLARFLTLVTVVVVAGGGGVLYSPLAAPLLAATIGVEGEVLSRAVVAMRVLLLIPIVVAVRNYWHGLALAGRRTWPMALGGVLRNVAIAACSLSVAWWGSITAAAGAVMLLAGFVAEALVVVVTGRGRASE